MLPLKTSPQIVDALLAACEPLFALFEVQPSLLPFASALIMALLNEAQSTNQCDLIVIRRIHARLTIAHRIADAIAAPIVRGKRLG